MSFHNSEAAPPKDKNHKIIRLNNSQKRIDNRKETEKFLQQITR